MKQIKMYMPKGTYFKKTKKVALTLIGFIALIIILINGIYIPIWLIWVGIGYALCPISAYLYLCIKKYIEKRKKQRKE